MNLPLSQETVSSDQSIAGGDDMKGAQLRRTVTSTARIIAVMVTISVTGCASNYSVVWVSPHDAATVLQPGDVVEITRKSDDSSVVSLRVKEIDDTHVFGSNQMSVFARKKETISLTDIASIKHYKKEDGYNYEESFEAWAYLRILVPFLP